MRQLLTVGVRSHFGLSTINQMWERFTNQLCEQPNETLFKVGQHIDWRTPDRKPHAQEVWVKLDKYPDGTVATMLLADEY